MKKIFFLLFLIPVSLFAQRNQLVWSTSVRPETANTVATWNAAGNPVAAKVALSTHVSGTLPVANGGTGLTALGTGLQVLRTNAGATALEFATISTGITNSATADELMKSNGTNAIGTGVYSTTDGSLLLGTTALSGNRGLLGRSSSAGEINFAIGIAASNAPNATSSKINSTGDTFHLLRFTSSNTWLELSHSSSTSIISGGAPPSGVDNGQAIRIIASNGSPATNGNGGDVHIVTGTGQGTGLDGNIGLFTSAGSFGAGEKVLFVANASTAPTTNPTAGFLFYSESKKANFWGNGLSVIQDTPGNEVFKLTSIATNDDPSILVYQNRAATTDATVTTLHTYTVPASTTVKLTADVVARRTGGTAGTAEDGAAYTIVATYKNVAGTATLIGSVTTLYSAESQAAWDATFTISGATVLVNVTGALNNNITWHLSELKAQLVSQ